MSKRFVIILWSIAGILAAFTIIVKSNQAQSNLNPTKLETGDVVLEKFPLKDIATMTIEDAHNTVTIKKGKTQWIVPERENYPADFSRFSDLVRVLTQVTVAQTVKAGPAFDERYGMNQDAENQENHGYSITLTNDAGDQLESLLIGKPTNSTMATESGAESGRYLRLGSDPKAVYAVNNPIEGLSGNPADWIDPTFLEVTNVQSMNFSAAPGTGFEGWSLSREDAEAGFSMSDIPAGKELDSAKTQPIRNALSAPQFADVLSEGDALARSNPEKQRNLVVTTFDGLEYTLTYAPEKSEQTEKEGGGNFIATISIDGELNDKRIKAEEESEDEAKLAEEQFEKLRGVKAAVLARNKAFVGRYFLVPDYVFSQFDLPKEDFLKEKEAPAATAPSPLQSGLALPNGNGEIREILAQPQEPGNPDGYNGLTEEDIRRIQQETQQQD